MGVSIFFEGVQSGSGGEGAGFLSDGFFEGGEGIGRGVGFGVCLDKAKGWVSGW